MFSLKSKHLIENMSKKSKIMIVLVVVIFICIIFAIAKGKSSNQKGKTNNQNAKNVNGIEMKVEPDGKPNQNAINNLKNIEYYKENILEKINKSNIINNEKNT